MVSIKTEIKSIFKNFKNIYKRIAFKIKLVLEKIYFKKLNHQYYIQLNPSVLNYIKIKQIPFKLFK